MKKQRSSWIALSIAGMLVALGLIWVVWPSNDKTTTEARLAEAPTRKTNRIRLSPEALTCGGIEAVMVTKQPLGQSLKVTGRIQINQDASARVGTPGEGRVTRVLATVGDRVRAGDPLVHIHSHELIQARADLAKARSDLARSRKALSYAQAELERATRLLEAKATSRREQLRAVADVTAAKAELEHAEAELHRAEEFLRHLGDTPGEEDLVIHSPIAGVVLQRNVTVGAIAHPSDDLLTISDLSTV